MLVRRLLALGSALILALSVTGCDKDDDSSSSGSEGTPRERPDPVPEQPEATCPAQCMTMLAGLNEYPRLAVWSVGYGTADYLRVKNLSRETVSFDGWHVAAGDQTAPLPSGITLEEGAFATINFGMAGASSNENIFVEGISLEPVGEVALYASDQFDDSDAIRTYVRWGGEPESGETSRMSVANEGGLWHRAGHVPLCDGYNRFGAVGDNMLPRGFRSMPDDCFPEYGGPVDPSRPPGR